MAIRLIASDLDGTLMAPDHMTVTQRTKNALLAMHEKGAKIAIATGRTLSFIENVTAQIPFVDYVIYSNGASVYDRTKKSVIYQNHISPEDTAAAVEMLSHFPVYYHIYAGGKIFVQNGREKYLGNLEMPDEFIKYLLSKFEGCDDVAQRVRGMDAEIFDLFSMNGEDGEKILGWFDSRGFITTSAVGSEVAVSVRGADKGTALKGLCEHLGIGANEVMAFGDAENDCPMLEFAEYSFAMDNGSDICKKSAKFSAPSNAYDGVAQMIEKYGLE